MSILYDALIRQQILIEGLKAGKQEETRLMIFDLQRNLRRVLAGVEYEELGSLNRKQLKKLADQLKQASREIFDPYLVALTNWLKHFMIEDSKLYAYIFSEAFSKEIAHNEETEERNWAIAFNLPLAANGVFAALFLRQAIANGTVSLEKLVNQGYANKWTIKEFNNALFGTSELNRKDGLMQKLFNQNNAVNNTLIQHLNAQAHLNNITGIISKYEWVSILDDRTTDVCRSRDGKRWLYGAGPLPPAHIGCRSIVVPVLSGAALPSESFNMWANRQPSSVREGLLKGPLSAKFDGARPLTLADLPRKRNLLTTA